MQYVGRIEDMKDSVGIFDHGAPALSGDPGNARLNASVGRFAFGAMLSSKVAVMITMNKKLENMKLQVKTKSLLLNALKPENLAKLMKVDDDAVYSITVAQCLSRITMSHVNEAP